MLNLSKLEELSHENLIAEIHQLREALRPFAEFAKKFDESFTRSTGEELPPDDGSLGGEEWWGEPLIGIKVGDCRKARKALE